MSFDLPYAAMLIPVFFVLGGLLAGIVIEKVVIAGIHRMARKTKWQGDDIIIGSFYRIIIFWGFLAGVYGAVLTVSPAPSIQRLLDKMLLVIAILSVTLFFMRLAESFINLYAERAKGVLPSTTLFVNIARAFILIIGLLVTLQALGIPIMPILTALGVGGLAVALALQDTLSNLFSGVQVIVSRQVRPGDYVRLNSGEEGYVTDINWRNTAIQSLAGNTYVIPNAKLASAIVTNYNLPEPEMSMLVQVGVSYDSDLDKVERVTVEVAKRLLSEMPGGVPEVEPFIRYHTFGDFSINFSVILRVKEFVEQYPVKHEFIKRLHRRYAQEGIEIPFPIRTIHLENAECENNQPPRHQGEQNEE
ncbi:MAG: mechanosensitive ion channel family protein [Bacillota bacterium]